LGVAVRVALVLPCRWVRSMRLSVPLPVPRGVLAGSGRAG
jgi:hypothetical protein